MSPEVNCESEQYDYTYDQAWVLLITRGGVAESTASFNKHPC